MSGAGAVCGWALRPGRDLRGVPCLSDRVILGVTRPRFEPFTEADRRGSRRNETDDERVAEVSKGLPTRGRSHACSIPSRLDLSLTRSAGVPPQGSTPFNKQ